MSIWILAAIISGIATYMIVKRAVRVSTTRVTAATERTAELIAYAMPQEKRDEYLAMCAAREADERKWQQQRTLVGVIALTVIILLYALSSSHAQGIYMGRDGRAHAQVIVGADGMAWPVRPSHCTPGLGPCPVILGAPLPVPSPVTVPPPVTSYAPPPPPAPLGWVWARYTACIEPNCATVAVSVAVDGLNVRLAPNGPVTLALVNGTPLLPLQQQGKWVLVAPACPLAPTGLWSSTANVPLGACL